MRGLDEKHDRDMEEAVILYGSRKRLDIRAFQVGFDDAFWEKVVEWAANHTAHREAGELPSADPEYGWECRFCDYRHRCGQSDLSYADEGPQGFLPDYDGYPLPRVEEYLQAHDDATLTPALAERYPNLAVRYKVAGWSCRRCGSEYAWDAVEWSGGGGCGAPVCPNCAAAGELSTFFQTVTRR